MSPIELKRRLTWLWRLSSSSVSEHIIDGGCTSAFWVFDTAHQPDGGILRPYMEQVARREGLRLRSFGPRRATISERLNQIAKFVSQVGYVLHVDFYARFARQVSSEIIKAFAGEPPSVLLIGASKGTFASIARSLVPCVNVWEVQHGLLDSSYFPLTVQRFYARSRVSARVISELSPHVDVEILCRSLEPPEGYVGPAGLYQVRELVCYSKNPGGGCTAKDLIIFEQACCAAAKCLGLKFRLQLHPRDNVLKLLWRHRRLQVLGWVHQFDGRAGAPPRLIVSAYSSALITESREGDRIINVVIGEPSEITRREYQWVPTVSVTTITNLSGTTDVFIRTR